MLFDRRSKGATSYLQLAKELMHQNGTIDSEVAKKEEVILE
jgi:hypothetical protein